MVDPLKLAFLLRLTDATQIDSRQGTQEGRRLLHDLNRPHLVETLGGEQLHGKEPQVAIRGILQNSQDGTMARKSLDPYFTDDEIVLTLTESGGTWILEVTDHGVGMDEDILSTALLDFGRTDWTSDTIPGDARRLRFRGIRNVRC